MSIKDRKDREFQRREEDILTAALALSNRDDWQEVTIDQIAKKAEVGKGTVYKHFRSKDDVYARLAANFHRLVLERLWVLDRNRPTADRVRDLIRVFWDTYGTHVQYQRVVDYCERPDFKRRISPDLRQAMQSLQAGFSEVIEDIVLQGVTEGVLPDRPKALMLFGVQAALVGALRLLWTGPPPGSPEQYVDELTAFILNGLTWPTSPNRAS